MRILRLLALSLTIGLFTLGGLISPGNTTLAHHCKGAHASEPECDDGGGSGMVNEAKYSLEFSSPILGSSNFDEWRGNNQQSIGFGGLGRNQTTTLDLNFFAALPTPRNGNICFAKEDVDEPIANGFYTNPQSMQVLRGRRGRPEAWFWIEEQTENGEPARYLLIAEGESGSLSKVWLPTEVDSKVRLVFTSWDMGLDNNQTELESTACLSNGPFEWAIEVTRVEPLDP